jgi:hypothetical protein
MSQIFDDIYSDSRHEGLLEMQDRINNNEEYSFEKREELGRKNAKLIYKTKGFIVDYYKSDGSKKTYKPTTQQVKERVEDIKSHFKAKYVILDATMQSWGNLIFWPIYCLICFLAGWYTPVEDKKSNTIVANNS